MIIIEKIIILRNEQDSRHIRSHRDLTFSHLSFQKKALLRFSLEQAMRILTASQKDTQADCEFSV